MSTNKFDGYLNIHLRECLSLVFLCGCFILSLPAAIVGVFGFLILIRKYHLPIWMVLMAGCILLTVGIFLENEGVLSSQTLMDFIRNGYYSNWIFLKKIVTGHYQTAWVIFRDYQFLYLCSWPLLIAGSLGIIDRIQKPAHAEVIKALQAGKLQEECKEAAEKKIATALKKINEDKIAGVFLGVSKYNAHPVTIPDKDINQVVLVLGTTGSGKTITIRRFYQRAVKKGYPLIIVDGKPDADNIKWVMDLAKKHNRVFHGFNCGNYCHYDPLKNGGYTELKDKIISLKDEWASDYYRSIAEDYLQTTFEVLLKNQKPIYLQDVVECLSYENLLELGRDSDEDIQKRVTALERYQRDDITGLQAHLNILAHSELGQFFTPHESSFTLSDVIAEGGIVYFALPALRFPSFSKVLGKLVINDLKAVVDRQRDTDKKIFTVFDEFSVFAGEQVLNLVNMGRGKGVHAIFGTQGLADLDKVDKTFKSQVLNCANTIFCHRLNDKDSAEAIAAWAGTEDKLTVTAQVSVQGEEGGEGLGSVHQKKEFIIHPDEIKQRLQTGEAFYISKVGKFRWDKVRVKMERGK